MHEYTLSRVYLLTTNYANYVMVMHPFKVLSMHVLSALQILERLGGLSPEQTSIL